MCTYTHIMCVFIASEPLAQGCINCPRNFHTECLDRETCRQTGKRQSNKETVKQEGKTQKKTQTKTDK